MSDNEDLTRTESSAVADEAADVDDVEGHGLKEVAAGLSAAAVVAGGTAALMHDSASTDSLRAGPNITQPEPSRMGDRLAEAGLPATNAASTSSASATDTTLAGQAPSETIDATRAARTGSGTDADLGAAPGTRRSTVGQTMDTADRMADATLETARNVRDRAVEDVSRTVDASGTVSDTRATADRTVAGAKQTVQDTANRAGEKVASTLKVIGDTAAAATGTTTTNVQVG
ncbi:MAG: hypothetical protein ABR520_07615, partial [Mycobacteriales bacterium]